MPCIGVREIPAHVPTGCGPAWPDYSHIDRQAAQESEFLAAARTAAMDDPAWFAPLTRDRAAPRGSDGKHPLRRQTVGEVLADSLECEGPSIVDVLDLLRRAADGRDIRAEAHALLGRMAAAWASLNSES